MTTSSPCRAILMFDPEEQLLPVLTPANPGRSKQRSGHGSPSCSGHRRVFVNAADWEAGSYQRSHENRARRVRHRPRLSHSRRSGAHLRHGKRLEWVRPPA